MVGSADSNVGVRVGMEHRAVHSVVERCHPAAEIGVEIERVPLDEIGNTQHARAPFERPPEQDAIPRLIAEVPAVAHAVQGDDVAPGGHAAQIGPGRPAVMMDDVRAQLPEHPADAAEIPEAAKQRGRAPTVQRLAESARSDSGRRRRAIPPPRRRGCGRRHGRRAHGLRAAAPRRESIVRSHRP